MVKRQAQGPGRSRDYWAIEALESAGAIGVADAERIRTEAPEWVASAVISAALAPAAEVAGILARTTRVPVADLALVEPPAVRIVPEALARLHFVLPLSANSRPIRVVTPNPLDIDAEQMLSFATSRTVSFSYTLPELLPPRLDEVYRPERQIERLVQGLDSGVEVETIQDTEQPDAGIQMVAEAPTARLVDAMIADAVRERASDVHCEPGDDGLLVRYRVDGVLREVLRVPRAASSPVVRRIKVMGRMDVSELPVKWRPGPDFHRTVAILAPKGCEQCAFTRYRGRFAIEEILTVTPEVAERIASGASADAIADEAKRHGMRPLWEAGLRRLWAGETSWDEIARVLGEPAVRPGAGAIQQAAGAAHPAAPEVASVGVPAQEEVRAGVTTAERPEGAGAQQLVLIADDDPTQRLLTSAILVREGFAVAEAADGMAALLEAGRLHPALILLDMEMPQLEGLSVLGALRATLTGRAMPVIVVTSKDDAATETRCIELGAEDFIVKPVREQTLVARIRAVLRRVAAAH